MSTFFFISQLVTWFSRDVTRDEWKDGRNGKGRTDVTRAVASRRLNSRSASGIDSVEGAGLQAGKEGGGAPWNVVGTEGWREGKQVNCGTECDERNSQPIRVSHQASGLMLISLSRPVTTPSSKRQDKFCRATAGRVRAERVNIHDSAACMADQAFTIATSRGAPIYL